MLKGFLICVIASLAATPAPAQITFEDQPAPAQTANAKLKEPNKIICERQEEIGSRLGGKKVCKTAAEWQEERSQQRRTLEDVQRQATSTGTPSG